jgi:hypothetical protein
MSSSLPTATNPLLCDSQGLPFVPSVKPSPSKQPFGVDSVQPPDELYVFSPQQSHVNIVSEIEALKARVSLLEKMLYK